MPQGIVKGGRWQKNYWLIERKEWVEGGEDRSPIQIKKRRSGAKREWRPARKEVALQRVWRERRFYLDRGEGRGGGGRGEIQERKKKTTFFNRSLRKRNRPGKELLDGPLGKGK